MLAATRLLAVSSEVLARLNRNAAFLVLLLAGAIEARVRVYPVFVIPSDVKIEAKELSPSNRQLIAYLAIAQRRYKSILRTDTFQIENGLHIHRLAHRNSFYTARGGMQKIDSAHRIARELLEANNETRSSSKRIYLAIFVRPRARPFKGGKAFFGGGRTFNGPPGTGGGYIEMEQQALFSNFPYPFLSTLVHEIGHAFGLTHVDCLGYKMDKNNSIMSYKKDHHSNLLEESSDPGSLNPEEFYLLSLNKGVFKNFDFLPSLHNPEKKNLKQAQGCMLGPMQGSIGKFEQMPGVGYELFFNGKLVSGAEAAAYSIESARKSCQYNKQAQKKIKVTCKYHGRALKL